MDEKDLRRLLGIEEGASRARGWRCPDEMELAAYGEHRLSPTDEARIESHLADCPACMEQVVFLAQHAAPGQATVAPPLLARAKDLVGARPAAWPGLVIRWGAVAAAAACLVIVVSLELRQPGAPPLPGARPAAAPAVEPSRPTAPLPGTAAASTEPARSVRQSPVASAPTVRKSAAKPLALRMVLPTENATLSAREPEFRWQAISGAVYYDIDIVTEEGNVVWQGKSEDTSTRLPADHPLRAGTKYFIWVRAHLSSGGTLKSPAVSFRIGS